MPAEGTGEWPHVVYRCYDADDVLLYIGCTQDINGRMATHKVSWHNPASAYLNQHMTRYTTEQYPNRRAARSAEKAAIAAEAPYLNIHHNKGRGAKRVPVEPMTMPEMQAQLAEAAEAFKGKIARGEVDPAWARILGYEVPA